MKVLVVCAQRYNGHELWTALGVMQEAGLEFEVVSTRTLIADEVTRVPNTIERTLDDLEDEEFDGLMFISGNMGDTEAYWKDTRTLDLVHQAVIYKKPIAAICCSVPTIREAARGRKVSFFPLVRSRELLVRAGAIPHNISITADGDLVTAEHQMGTQVWAEAFVEVLNGRTPILELEESGFSPEGKTQRRMHPRLERLAGIEIHPKNRKAMGIE